MKRRLVLAGVPVDVITAYDDYYPYFSPYLEKNGGTTRDIPPCPINDRDIPSVRIPPQRLRKAASIYQPGEPEYYVEYMELCPAVSRQLSDVIDKALAFDYHDRYRRMLDFLDALEQAKEPTIPELLSRYLDKRSEERTGWTTKGKLKGTVGDFNKVMEALDFLRQKEISTVESLDAYLDEASAQAVSIREEIRPMEKRVKEIDRLLFHIGNFEANKPVHAKYAAIRWKKPKEKFAADHKEELDAYNTALRYFKVHLDGTKYSTKKLAEEQAQLSENIASKTEALTAVQEDVKILRDVRHWLNQVLPSEQYRQTAEPGKKPSIQQAVKGREQRIREEQAEKRQQPRRQQKQDMEL